MTCGCLSPPHRAALCSRPPPCPLWKGTSRSHPDLVFSLFLFSLSPHLFSVEKYVPMPRYSKASAVFRRPGCSSGSKTDRSGYWHVNQCADLARSPAKPPALSSASGCRWFESLGCALHGNDGNHFKFTVASERVLAAGLAWQGCPIKSCFLLFFL